jgi:hypothetical protein
MNPHRLIALTCLQGDSVSRSLVPIWAGDRGCMTKNNSVQRDLSGVESKLKWSILKNYITEKIFLYSKGLHHESSKNRSQRLNTIGFELAGWVLHNHANDGLRAFCLIDFAMNSKTTNCNLQYELRATVRARCHELRPKSYDLRASRYKVRATSYQIRDKRYRPRAKRCET